MDAYEIISRGHPGYNSSQLAELFEEEVASQSPRVVVLLAGTNDCLNTHNLNPLDGYHANLARMIERAANLGAAAIVCTILPCVAAEVLERHDAGKYPNADPMSAVAGLNEVIRNTVAGCANAIPVDLYSEFEKAGWQERGLIRTRDNCGQSDGVHPTAAGYELIARSVYTAVKSAGISGGKIICFGDSITFGVNVAGAGTVGGQTYPGQLDALLRAS